MIDDAALVQACSRCGQKNRIPVKHLAHTGRCGACKAVIAPADHPIDAEAALFERLIRESPVPLLVDFWAAWCGPCRMMAPELEKLAAAHSGKLLVVKVDTERSPQLAQQFAIEALPTVVLFRGGQPERRLSGARSASSLARELSL